MMYSSSFQSPKPLAQYFKKHSSTVLRHVILVQSNPISYHTEANGCIFFWRAVLLFTLHFFYALYTCTYAMSGYINILISYHAHESWKTSKTGLFESDPQLAI